MSNANSNRRTEPADASDDRDDSFGNGRIAFHNEATDQAQIPEYDYCAAPEARKTSQRTYKPAG
jgi:hypothetical protein